MKSETVATEWEQLGLVIRYVKGHMPCENFWSSGLVKPQQVKLSAKVQSSYLRGHQCHYCSNHDLNLALCKSCEVKEVQLMLDTLKQLGIFFRYSPK